MEFITQYAVQDGEGTDRAIYSRRITHVQGDSRRFYIVAEGANAGSSSMISFTHQEFENLIVEYQTHRPVHFRNGFSIHGPTMLINVLNRVVKRFPTLAAAKEKATNPEEIAP